MPDCDPLQPPALAKKPRRVFVPQIGRQPRIDPGDIFGHASEEIHPNGTQQRIQDRLVDFGRPEAGGKRRDIFFRAGLDLRRDARGMQAEGGLEAGGRQIELARDQERAPQFLDGLLRRQLRPLVEPFRRHQFGARAHRRAPAFDLDLHPHEDLRRGIDRHGAKPKRLCERNLPLEKRDITHGQTMRHGYLPQSSAPWVKKCLRMRCTSSVKIGSAMVSSERGRCSGTS